MNKDEIKILELVKLHKKVNVNWMMSDFYEDVCDWFGWPFSDIENNSMKMRAYLIELKKNGHLKSSGDNNKNQIWEIQ